MGLLDQLAGSVLGQAGGAGVQNDMLGGIMELINQQEGGLGGLVSKFQNGGLGDIVNSWVSRDENLPVSAEQIQAVLGNEQIASIASRLGLDPNGAASGLAQFLPQVIDKLTPDGTVDNGNPLLSMAADLLKSKLFG